MSYFSIKNTANFMPGNMGNSDDRMDDLALMASSGFLAHNIMLRDLPYIC